MNLVPENQETMATNFDDAPESRAMDGYITGKTFADRALAAVLLVATAPLMLLMMAIVKLTSRGPAIYTQPRVGLGGRTFVIYKIRSMYQDAEARSGAMWSVGRDPRVTPIGRILRQTHLDELPQLWNIFRGEMSLVGPRPERPEMIEKLAGEIPGYRGRLAVLPGLTGLAQVYLPPDAEVEDVRRKLVLDLYYIRHIGLWLDFRLLLSTAMFLGGISFGTSRRWLRLPGDEAFQTARPVLMPAVDSKPQIQPA